MRAIASLTPALDRARDAAAAAQIAADHIATDPQLTVAVYFESGGRLRRATTRGAGLARDGLPAEAGETVSADAREAHLPVFATGRPVGALHVGSREPLRDGDLDDLRACAAALGRRLDSLGGPPSESATHRLARHTAAMAELDDPRAVADALLTAVLELTPVDSAAMLRTDGEGLVAVSATGPLGRMLGRNQRLAERVRDGASAVELAQPAGEAASLVAVGLFTKDEHLGTLLAASRDPDGIDTDDVALLEELAAHAAACLRTVEELGTLRRRAATDPLTGLGHHATFHEALASSHRRPTTAVVVCDIDGFKRLNDAHGHGHGDRVLCGVADAMSGALRRGDPLFRIGGDEFAALLAVGSDAEALEAAARLREAVDAAGLGVTVSVGVAVPHEDEPDASVLARADRALYAVKASGRDGVALANDEPLPAAPARAGTGSAGRAGTGSAGRRAPG